MRASAGLFQSLNAHCESSIKILPSFYVKQKPYFYYKAMNHLYNFETENKDTTTLFWGKIKA